MARRGKGDIPTKWRKLFALIPEYDPIATAAPGDWFDARAAEKVIAFIETELTHVEGELAGKPLILADWQRAVTGCAFGWKRSDGTRRYREALIGVARKNGKTTWAAALVLAVAFCDGELGAQLYSAAAEREQAALVYRQAKGMLLANETLAEMSRVYASFKSIEFPDNSIYKALSADADTKHGYNPHVVIVDELHAHANGELVDVLITGTGARKQPLIWHITTSDWARESMCNAKWDYAEQVRHGVIQDRAFLPALWQAEPKDDWKSPATWRKANPNLGVSVSEDYLVRECKRAQDVPAYENVFKRLHLNIRTEQDVRWLALDSWDACADDYEESALEGQECYAALDLSSTRDLTAEVLWFPEARRVLAWFWAPEDNAPERERRDRVPYVTWARQGALTLTPGNVVDYDFIRAHLNKQRERFNIVQIALDPWNATHLITQLAGDGFDVVKFRQGFVSMSPACKEVEKLIVGRQLKHNAHAILRWCMSNVSVQLDAAGNLKPSKEKSTERIDGAVALIMAVGASIAGEGAGASVYETRGVLTL